MGPCSVQLAHHPLASHRDIIHGERGLGSPFSLHEILGKNMVLTQGECCREGISSS